ncbi:type III secretion system export apparatus subunit SctT [Aquibium microcysteis]|uniref:type III secretion system export apparatus subunit SctT n=1 Tax=Aquibium microcysteis TaxID=675281 RepID=UPI00165D2DCF|nr:type III secretion system export apparatus subunit SctT [Aquibium microcysteis]
MNTAVLMELLGQYKPLLLSLLLSMGRTYAFLAASQILSPSAVPRLARTAAVLVLVAPLVPLNAAFAQGFDPGVATFAALFAKEYAVGFLIGFLIAWLFWAVQAAGAFIDNQRGAAIASSIDPLQGHETSPLGNLFSQAFLTYFFAIGGFLLVVDLLYSSFQVWPVTRGLPIVSEAVPSFFLGVMDSGMRLMFVLAAPIIALMFLAEFGLAIVSRFAPQIQVFILAMPIKSAIAILILIFYFSTMFDVAGRESESFRSLLDRFYAMLEFGSDAVDRLPPPSDGEPRP